MAENYDELVLAIKSLMTNSLTNDKALLTLSEAIIERVKKLETAEIKAHEKLEELETEMQTLSGRIDMLLEVVKSSSIIH